MSIPLLLPARCMVPKSFQVVYYRLVHATVWYHCHWLLAFTARKANFVGSFRFAIPFLPSSLFYLPYIRYLYLLHTKRLLCKICKGDVPFCKVIL